MKDNNSQEIEMTTYDRLLRAWENSKELTRDYEMYSKRVKENDVANLFKQLAESEGAQAASLKDFVARYQNE